MTYEVNTREEKTAEVMQKRTYRNKRLNAKGDTMREIAKSRQSLRLEKESVEIDDDNKCMCKVRRRSEGKVRCSMGDAIEALEKGE